MGLRTDACGLKELKHAKGMARDAAALLGFAGRGLSLVARRLSAGTTQLLFAASAVVLLLLNSADLCFTSEELPSLEHCFACLQRRGCVPK